MVGTVLSLGLVMKPRDEASKAEDPRASRHKNDTQASVKRVARFALSQRGKSRVESPRKQRNNRREY